MKLQTHILATSFFYGAALAAGAPAGTTMATTTDDTTRTALHRLFDEQWEFWMREIPTWASTLGDRRWNDQWSEETASAYARRDAHDKDVLSRLRKLDHLALTPEDQLNFDLFARKLDDDIDERRWRTWLMPVGHQGGIQTQDELADALRFTTVKDYDDWLRRLERLGDRVDQTVGLMRQGMKEGLVPPRVLMQRVPPQIAHQIVADPEQSPFYKAFRAYPESIAEADRKRLSEGAKKAIRDVVVPAYQRLAEFFNREYLPACRTTIAASELPQGAAYYASCVRRETTTALTPQEIHAIGLKEVARIHGEMEAIIQKLEFKGDFAAFLQFLRSDPRFFAKDGAELLAIYRATSKRIDPELVKLFGKLPRMPYGVQPIPDEIAPDTTTAYYNAPAADGSRAGTYFVNLYKPEVRPLWEIEALSVHEAVPGHHLQIALAMELSDLPRFRRYTGPTSYIEGWGLYAESLGGELGLYQDPYAKFGQLTYEMWRAVRLVVDTGMHSLGWSRAQAIDYFKANAAKTEYDIVNEIDRYIAWPGQALAYKVGELKIKELRARAAAALGLSFDVRRFHDTVLEAGAVPLDVLERRVDAWIAREKAGAR